MPPLGVEGYQAAAQRVRQVAGRAFGVDDQPVEVGGEAAKAGVAHGATHQHGPFWQPDARRQGRRLMHELEASGREPWT